MLAEWTLAGLHQSLLRELSQLPRATPVLDLGCGSGAWLVRLAEAGFTDLHGVDLDVGSFGVADGRATCTRADLDGEDLGLGERRFGLVSAIEVVEHLENPGRLFDHVARHLAPDGVFLLTTPNVHSLHCRLRLLLNGKLQSFDEKGNPSHLWPVLLSTLPRMLTPRGLELRRCWGYPAAGSLVSRAPLRLAATALRLLLPEAVPGDILCLLIQKAGSVRPAW